MQNWKCSQSKSNGRKCPAIIVWCSILVIRQCHRFYYLCSFAMGMLPVKLLIENCSLCTVKMITVYCVSVGQLV